MISILPSLGAPPLPDFQDPVKGFEPRGTKLSDEIVTLQNFYAKLQDRTILLHHQGGTRKRRSVQRTLEPPLSPVKVYNRMIFLFKATDPKEDLFAANKLKTICAMDSEVLRASSNFTEYCNGIFDDTTGKTQCYSSSSLGNYVALLNDRKSCQDITDRDVSTVKNLLLNCSSYFVKQTLESNCYSPTSGVNGTAGSSCTNVPAECTKYNGVYNIFYYLVDNEMGPSNDMFLKYTVSLPAGSL
ncbi:Protein dispatched 1 [Desmophyllum pertusum]|uniref:Protein dispatched 1 n=1 Tax=Desmophyllum pertusum TaxID=174260 RepID=A0A9W9YD28_9CNID|nr:Protein dispatched 1 [Desmophyllum pertusum]